jgi:hypothetical protein
LGATGKPEWKLPFTNDLLGRNEAVKQPGRISCLAHRSAAMQSPLIDTGYLSYRLVRQLGAV